MHAVALDGNTRGIKDMNRNFHCRESKEVQTFEYYGAREVTFPFIIAFYRFLCRFIELLCRFIELLF